MSYQSKTYSLSDEVVEAIETAKASGESPNQYLWRVIFSGCKPSKRELIAAELAASDLTAKVVDRDDIEYGHHDTAPRGQHVTHLDVVGSELSGGRGKATSQTYRRPLLKPGQKGT